MPEKYPVKNYILFLICGIPFKRVGFTGFTHFFITG